MQVKVISPHEASYPYNVILSPGERINFENRESDWPGWFWCIKANGQAAWIPASYIDCQGAQGIVLKSYNSIELTVIPDEILEISETESGWGWCTNGCGQQGWVPLNNLSQI